jgi:hypothetical protein
LTLNLEHTLNEIYVQSLAHKASTEIRNYQNHPDRWRESRNITPIEEMLYRNDDNWEQDVDEIFGCLDPPLLISPEVLKYDPQQGF